ncbi:MAG: patatin-like phospholipase family protein [Acidobacteriota bacterium]
MAEETRLPGKVFEKEWKTIQDRRRQVTQCESGETESSKALRPADSPAPSPGLSLFGLAFSGGGIRSATFNLGVLQVLAEKGILKHVDYLSTVSGGGYIGSCLSALLNDPTTYPYLTEEQRRTRPEPPDPFPLRHRKRIVEPEALRHLRNSGNYLLGRGTLVEKLRIPALILRGLALNLLILLPYIVLAVFLTQTLFQRRSHSLLEYTPFALLGWLVLVVLFVFTNHLLSKVGWRKRSRLESLWGWALLLLIVFFVVDLLPFLLYHYESGWLSGLQGSLPSLAGVLSLATAAAGLLGTRGDSEKGSLKLGSIAIYFLALAGVLLFILIYLEIGSSVLHNHPTLDLLVIEVSPRAFFYWGALFVFLITRLFVDINATSFHGFYRDRLSKAYLFGVKRNPAGGVRVEHRDDLKLSDLNNGTPAPYHLVNVTLNLQGSQDEGHLRGREADFFILSKHYCGGPRTGYVATEKLEKIDPHLDLGTAMAISGAAAAPNLGRMRQFQPIAYLLAVLNIRLGYWLANPRKMLTASGEEIEPTRLGRRYRRARPVYLFKEALNRLDDRKYLINITDGGHLENTGIYELLRRRCKYIICGDAEADPDMTFGALATLIRFARIDMGIEIEINLDDLRKDESGNSRRHCALGTIRYPEGAAEEVGYLLYIKSSVRGDENEYIREYRSKHPQFPHQTTADQFFDEAQFEAYRALGYQAAKSIFQGREETQASRSGEESVGDFFGGLQSRLLPAPDGEEVFIELHSQLSKLEESYRDPQLAKYSYLLCPEINPGRFDRQVKWSTEERRRVFHLCNQQMQLMETVYLSLRLEREFNRNHPRNRGWINLFRRWMQTPQFLEAWGVSIGTFSVGFQNFCELAFGYRWSMDWRRVNLDPLSSCERAYYRKHRQAGCQVWQARVCVRHCSCRALAEEKQRESSSVFPVGFALLRRTSTKPPAADVLFVRVRSEYRKMRVFERMVRSLPEHLRRSFRGATPQLDILLRRTEVGPQLSRFRAFFRRSGYQVRVE